jgi:hypothetical protein
VVGAIGHCCCFRRRPGAATRRAGTSGDQGLSHTADRGGAFSQVQRSCFSTAPHNSTPEHIHKRQSTPSVRVASCQAAAAATHAQARSTPNRQRWKPRHSRADSPCWFPVASLPKATPHDSKVVNRVPSWTLDPTPAEQRIKATRLHSEQQQHP